MELDNLRFIGRHIIKNNQPYFSFSGSGFIFHVVPENNNCLVKLVLNSEIREESTQFLAIYINDVFYSKYMVINGHAELYLTINKDSIIRIIKANEVYLSSIYLEDIVVTNGKMVKVEEVKRKLIGFFGDSLTCGYGLLDYQGQQFRMETEDFTKSYAYLAANELNMDYDVVARSGISVGVPIYMPTLFKDIYDTVDMFDKYEMNRKLDYAVINLGSNDNSAIFQFSKEEQRNSALNKFKEECQSLIERIIKDNENVKIILCYHIDHLHERTLEKIKEVYEDISSKYENKCLLLGLKHNSDGACYHPFFLTHADNAKILVNAIKDLEKEEKEKE